MRCSGGSNLSYKIEAGGCIDQPEGIYAQIFLKTRSNSGAQGVYNSKFVSANSRVRVEWLDNNCLVMKRWLYETRDMKKSLEEIDVDNDSFLSLSASISLISGGCKKGKRRTRVHRI